MIALILAATLYVQCDVAVGRLQSCSATTYSGSAVVEVEGRYRRCKIANGQAHECEGWFSGTAPALGHDGRWHACRISTGKMQTCETVGYHGSVIAHRHQG
jgi:hypothetical protein